MQAKLGYVLVGLLGDACLTRQFGYPHVSMNQILHNVLDMAGIKVGFCILPNCAVTEVYIVQVFLEIMWYYITVDGESKTLFSRVGQRKFLSPHTKRENEAGNSKTARVSMDPYSYFPENLFSFATSKSKTRHGCMAGRRNKGLQATEVISRLARPSNCYKFV
jgi:hypothetical protein